MRYMHWLIKTSQQTRSLRRSTCCVTQRIISGYFLCGLNIEAINSEVPAKEINTTPVISRIPNGSSVKIDAAIVATLISVKNKTPVTPGLNSGAPHVKAKVDGISNNNTTGTNHGNTEKTVGHSGALAWPKNGNTMITRAMMDAQKK